MIEGYTKGNPCVDNRFPIKDLIMSGYDVWNEQFSYSYSSWTTVSLLYVPV